MSGGKNKTVCFLAQDDALLAWCETRRESFSQFVLRVLYEAMAREQHGGKDPPAAGPSIAEIRAVIRQELATVQIAAGEPEKSEQAVDTDIEFALDNLFNFD